MKKELLSALLISLTFISCSDTDDPINLPVDNFVNIPDAIFEQKLINLGIDSDGEINQLINRQDAESVEFLDVSSSTSLDEIEDLTGIEAFTSLKRLHASGNKLETIELSSNIYLDTLNLSGNLLKTIDVSNNSRLVELNLMSNDLTEFKGLFELTKLKWLNLSFNYFQEFYLTNSSIEHLLMSHNDLTNFNSESAPNLKTILLRLNQLSSLNFSNNIKLEGVIVSGNKLESIYLKNSPNLEYLYCASNQLKQFDVSMFSKLDYFHIDRNPELSCIKIAEGQVIPTLSLSDYQSTNTNCD